MTNEVFIYSAQLDDAASGFQGDDVTMHLMKAPSESDGGGITLLGATFVNGAATNAGTAFALQLENWGTAGNAIKTGAAGTIDSIGGTADVFAADTPKAFSVSGATAFLDAGEYLVLRKNEENSSDPTRGSLIIEYAMGR